MARGSALVTGASSGIGDAFARQLAARGHDLIVVARNQARLEALAKELGEAHDVDVEVLAADLTDEAALADVAARAAGVDTLINNAGYGTFGSFHELALAPELDMIQLNIAALVKLTHVALAPMVERGGGGILNVSSMAAFAPSATFATYAATKAFVTSFSQAVREEVRGTGVNVCVLMPGLTRTEFQDRAGVTGESKMPEQMWQTADEVARAGLDGLDGGRATVVPGALNKATAAITGLTPDRVTRRIAAKLATQI